MKQLKIVDDLKKKNYSWILADHLKPRKANKRKNTH